VGSGVARIVLTGTGFVPASVVQCGGEGANRETILESDTVLYAYLHKQDRETGERNRVRVFNPLPGGGASAWKPIHTLPIITGFDIVRNVANGVAVDTLVVGGANFQPELRLWYGDTERKTGITIGPNHDQVSVRLSADDFDSMDAQEVRVCNPDPVGGVTTFRKTLPRTPAPGPITLDPTRIDHGNAVTITITGTNFAPLAYVQVDDLKLPAVPGADPTTTLAVTLSAEQTANPGVRKVSVCNPKPGGGASPLVDFTVS
jgi:hypothetical protein